MNSTKKDWLDAILRCMKQDNYGTKDNCELCKQAGYWGDPNCDPDPKCHDCVCHDFIKDEKAPFGDGTPCVKYLDVCNVEFSDTGTIQQILQQVYDWLKAKEEI